MSFGTSVGDIISLIQLAHRSYRNCKDAGGEYLEIAREVRSLHSVLKSVREEAEKPNSMVFESRNLSEFLSISNGCEDVLESIDKLLAKYDALADNGVEKKKSKKLWHRMRFGAELDELGKYRWKIITYTSQLAVFLDAIHLKSSNRLENKLESGLSNIMDRLDGFEDMRKAVLLIATKARASERYTSVASIGSVLSLSTYPDDDKQVWKQFRSELVALGFRSDSLERHREVLKAYMMRLNTTGVLDEAVALEAKSTEPWCSNSFFRLTYTDLARVEENSEDVVGDDDSRSDETQTLLPGNHKDKATTSNFEDQPTVDEENTHSSHTPAESSQKAFTPSLSSRRQVTQRQEHVVGEQPVARNRNTWERDPIPARAKSSLPLPTAHEEISSITDQGNGEKTNASNGRLDGNRSTPYQSHGGEKLDPFCRVDLERPQSPQPHSQPQITLTGTPDEAESSGLTSKPGESADALYDSSQDGSDSTGFSKSGIPSPYAESYDSDTSLESNESIPKSANITPRDSPVDRSPSEATRTHPTSRTESGSVSNSVRFSLENTLNPKVIPTRSRSRLPHGHSRAHTSYYYDSDRSKTPKKPGARDRGRDISQSPDRFQQAAKVALIAGATEAFRARNEPGGWMGDKGKRVLTAALGASMVMK